jgi:hypothetical protein
MPSLVPVSERVISPRLPVMYIRRLRQKGSSAIGGQVINVPVRVCAMLMKLARQLIDDCTCNVAIKLTLAHKSVCLQGYKIIYLAQAIHVRK